MDNSLTDIFRLVTNASRILLVTHPRPDGDALGSLTAMIGLCKAHDINYRAFCFDPVPDVFKYLPYSEEVISDIPALSGYVPDVVVYLDVADGERAKITPFLKTLPHDAYRVLVFDHHIMNVDLGVYHIVGTEYSSTAEIVYEFFTANHVVISRPMATALLTGIITDTENFTNAGTRAETLAAASELMRLGANLDKVTKFTWQSRSFSDLKLFGLALERLIHHPDYGTVVTCITQDDTSGINGSQPVLEGFPNFLKCLSDGRATIVLKETEGLVKASLRSVSPDVNVAKFAEVFGGGGHRLAAGFAIPGKLVNENNQWKVV